MKNHEYDAHHIEQQAQTFWDKNKSFKACESLDQPSFYCLSMWPYPSGELHMGHVRNYTLSDVIARIKTMQGYHVLHPLGWDAFGLPAENAAIKNKTCPAKWTLNNINRMRKQLIRLGLSIDWSREITTCTSAYYQWNQWLFLKMYEKGLAYQRKSTVNWDPVDQTVLANEQVINGCGWRSGAPVQQKKINQWFFKITAYADELLNELDTLDGWPKEVVQMQRNWIGRNHGVDVHFSLCDNPDETLIAFTTRIDTVFGVSFIALAIDHPIALKSAKTCREVAAFIKQCQTSSTSEKAQATADKKGIQTQFYAIHPLTGKKIAIWICNYVLKNYGTGCLMGVPAHDERDHAFAKAYDLAILPVIRPLNIEESASFDFNAQAMTDAEGVLINSQQYDGLSVKSAQEKLLKTLHSQASGGESITYRLRDWGISRQRYWGTPIPIVYCDQCGVIPVDTAQLPVELPILETLNGQGNPLEQAQQFRQTKCPNCGGMASRETDTMDTFVDSSWYFLRYTCPDQTQAMLDDRAKFWSPIDQYVGGIEHATMHLLYARFIHKVLRDLGLLNSNEPFKRLLTQGMVLKDGQKMSKSKGNVVSPMPLLEQYGADTIRLYSMFTAPPEQTLEWCDTGVEGAHRFLKKLWAFAQTWRTSLDKIDLATPLTDAALIQTRTQLHRHLQQICFDIDRQQFNTVVSGIMKLMNTLTPLTTKNQQTSLIVHEGLSYIIRLLAPIAPHICHILWVELGYGENILLAALPTPDPHILQDAQIRIIVQINGKLRGDITINPDDANAEKLTEMAMQCENVKKHLKNKPIRRTIVVPGKLVNFVV